MRGNNVPWRPDPLANCSMIIDARYISLCACEQVPIWVEQQRLGKEEEQPLDCLCAWAAWVCGAMALSHTLSFFLTLSLFSFIFFLLSFFNLSPYFSLSFLSKVRLTPSWNKDTPLDGWNLTLSDFPHTWTFVWKSSVQYWGLLLSVFQLQRASKCSADAVLIFLGIAYPLFFLIFTWNG